jgi:hypothetical protein
MSKLKSSPMTLSTIVTLFEIGLHQRSLTAPPFWPVRWRNANTVGKGVFEIQLIRNSVCFFLNSVYVVYGIALNSAELRGITYYGIRRIPRNFAEFHDF